MNIEPININYPLFNRFTNFDTEELTTLELQGRTTQKVNEIIAGVNDGVASIVGKEDSTNISVNRKLSNGGNFTGSLDGQSVSLTLAEIADNKHKNLYLTSQFQDGQTGLVIDGGFFADSDIKKNYNGGVF